MPFHPPYAHDSYRCPEDAHRLPSVSSASLSSNTARNRNKIITKPEAAAQHAVSLTEYHNNQEVASFSWGRKPEATSTPKSSPPAGAKEVLKQIFLPKGFPDSVTDDYVPYQIWDTTQALASSLTAVLSTAAILKGAGVGDQNATVLAASLSWVLKDGVGMFARIVFAWIFGTSLDADSKRWRLTADALNDIAFFIDLLCAHLPSSLFMACLCTSSAMRAIVGVAGGGTRMAVVRHQARRENLADVAAKDGSQETLVGVISLLSSLVILPAIENNYNAVWALFGVLTVVHLTANYMAVSSLHIDVLNQARLKIAVKKFLESGSFPSVKEANSLEPVVPWRFGRSDREYGCSLAKLMKYANVVDFEHNGELIAKIGFHDTTGVVCLARGISNEQILSAALFLELHIKSPTKPARDCTELLGDLQVAGWNTNSHLLNLDEYSFM